MADTVENNQSNNAQADTSRIVEPTTRDVFACASAIDIKLPSKIRVVPCMALKAMTTQVAGGYRYWLFTRSLDKSGSGSVSEDLAKIACLNAGITPKTLQNWLRQALETNLLERKIRRDGVAILLYKSTENAAPLLGCEEIDSRACYLESNLFISGDWRNAVWEAFIQINFNHKTVSREILHQITGINRYQQVRLEKGTSIENWINVAQTGVDASYLTGMKENLRPSAFVYNGEVSYRLPDTRNVTEEIEVTSKRRAKAINQSLRNKSSVSGFIGRELSNLDGHINGRLFFSDEKEANKAHRRYGAKDIVVQQLFYPLQVNIKGGKVCIWIPISK